MLFLRFVSRITKHSNQKLIKIIHKYAKVKAFYMKKSLFFGQFIALIQEGMMVFIMSVVLNITKMSHDTPEVRATYSFGDKCSQVFGILSLGLILAYIGVTIILIKSSQK